jgi:hypothetical protein
MKFGFSLVREVVGAGAEVAEAVVAGALTVGINNSRFQKTAAPGWHRHGGILVP